MTRVTLIKGKEKRVATGHPWIFKSDIENIEGEYVPGDVVEIYSFKNKFLAKGYLNLKSQISLRILTYNQQEEINYDFLYNRINNAIEYRKKFCDINSCRLIFAESDLLPALIVDKFSDYLVIQTLALGIERFKEQIVDILIKLINPKGIYERNDVHVRELEGLEQTKGLLYGEVPDSVEMIENGVKFLVDIKNGQKTGFFLDQKDNRAAIKPYVYEKEVLDCFCHTGSFSCEAGSFGAKNVIGVDISDLAVKFATENAKLNNLNNVSFIEANVFDKLREYHDLGKKFDVVILDPPAFTKSKETIESAIRGYKEINLRAMQIIRSGGFLVSCSCSHHIDNELFLDIIYDAAIDTKKILRLLEYRGHSKDHPSLLASPETNYLKAAIFQVL